MNHDGDAVGQRTEPCYLGCYSFKHALENRLIGVSDFQAEVEISVVRCPWSG
jgi:hypothetical protein